VRPLDPRLLRYASRARLPIAVLAALGAASAGLLIVQAQFLATAIAGAFTGHDALAALTVPVVGLALVVAVRAALAWATHAVSHRASAAATAQLRHRLLAHAVRLGPSWLAGKRTAELAELATKGIDDLEGYFTSYLPALVLAAVVPLAVLVRVAVADPWSGLVIALTLPLVPLFGALIGMATASHAKDRWQALGTLAHHFLDVVSGLPTLKVFGRAKAQQESVARVTEQYRLATMATLRLAFLSAFALELIATTSVAMVAVEIGLRIDGGSLSLRTGLLALILAPEAYLPLRTVSAQFHATADGLAAASEVFAVIETPAPGVAADAPRADLFDDKRFGKAALATTTAHDHGALVVIDNVTVRYEGRSAPAPDGISLVIAPGKVTALAGPSGCGKSTLIRVLLGFTPADQGRILITARGGLAGHGDGGSGVDLRALDPDRWRSMVGWVPQDPTLFPGTVADNIRLGWTGAPDEAVQAAARAAALDDVPLDAPVADRGTGLSAGQRRRVALARALLPGAAGPASPDGTPRPVLLLDEPTAGLDPVAEARVIATLRAEAARGRAILVVSHHPAVLAAADDVVRAGQFAEWPRDAEVLA
jgi:thiol reductant ABC exporter CydD subunit